MNNSGSLVAMLLMLNGIVVCLSPQARAAAPVGNTKLGKKALVKNTGANNTALGFQTLNPNAFCTGAGAPIACCTGKGAGTCGGNSVCGAAGAPFACCSGVGTGKCGNSGGDNTAVGANVLQTNTDGSSNTGVGSYSLSSNTSGGGNTAVGGQAMQSSTTGSFNTAVGNEALSANTAGSSNTALGHAALTSNDTGDENTALGKSSLEANDSGTNNTAVGHNALLNNSDGSYNTAVGDEALLNNDTGGDNIAVGAGALSSNDTGSNNIAVGSFALESNGSGTLNTAIGRAALSNSTGSGNIGLGANAGVSLSTGNDNIDIGNNGVAGESNTIRIGTAQTATFIAGIYGTTIGGGATLALIDSTGQLGTMPSSRRYKTDIHDMGDSTSKLLQLRPVTFKYNPELDPSGTRQYGLVAEEVAEVLPDLVARDNDGKIETVKYQLLATMLLNEVQKQARQIEALSERLERLDSRGHASADACGGL